MKDFIYDGGVKIIYGADQQTLVAQEIAKLGKRLLIVPTGSFVAGGHLEELKDSLVSEGIEVSCLTSGREPLLSKVKEGVKLCNEKQIEVIIGIGGGVSMDLAKTIAFRALNQQQPMEKYLTSRQHFNLWTDDSIYPVIL